MESRSTLRLRSVTKRFGALTAADAVDLDVRRGEIIALLGENGAGKSTLVNLVAGMLQPDEGTIEVGGRPVTLHSTRDAIHLGIGMVHQHFMLVPGMTVVENVMLGHRGGTAGRLDLRREARRITERAAALGLPIDPWARVGTLDVAGQQRAEILKVLMRDVRLLILDEPTAVLSQPDCDRLFDAIRRLADTGVSVVLITHKLRDVSAVCDRVAVMRRGRLEAVRPADGLDEREIVRLMVGEDVSFPQRKASPVENVAPSRDLARVESVVLDRADGSRVVEGIDFRLRTGEILAFAGVEGNGQSELVRCLAALERPAGGRIEMLGLRSDRPKEWLPHRLRAAGLAHVPEDRRHIGIIEGLDLADNFLLSHHFRRSYTGAGLVRRRRLRGDVQQGIDAYSIRADRIDQRIGELSGGNQQKLVMAREMLTGPRVVLAAHPTRGLDVRTIAFVQRRLIERRDAGAGIILVSADLSEIWALADRVIVFGGGRVRGPVRVDETDPQEVGRWMAGR